MGWETGTYEPSLCSQYSLVVTRLLTVFTRLLTVLTGCHTPAQVVSAELDVITERVRVLETKMEWVHEGYMSVQELLRKQEKAASRQERYTLLQEFLEDFWAKFMGKLSRKVEAEKFCQGVVDWFKEHRCVGTVLVYVGVYTHVYVIPHMNV